MNWEIEETLRQKFIDETKNKLWTEDTVQLNAVA